MQAHFQPGGAGLVSTHVCFDLVFFYLYPKIEVICYRHCSESAELWVPLQVEPLNQQNLKNVCMQLVVKFEVFPVNTPEFCACLGISNPPKTLLMFRQTCWKGAYDEVGDHFKLQDSWFYHPNLQSLVLTFVCLYAQTHCALDC